MQIWSLYLAQSKEIRFLVVEELLFLFPALEYGKMRKTKNGLQPSYGSDFNRMDKENSTAYNSISMQTHVVIQCIFFII
jgi:hypothetical protein